MENQFTREKLGKFVDNRGRVDLLSADLTVIGRIDSGKLDDWKLAESAEYFYFDRSRYSRAAFQELIYRELLPGNPAQIDLPAL